MKQISTIIFTFLLFAVTTNAQHFNIGVKGGLNAYNITHNDVFDKELKVGLHCGLIGHVHVSNRFAMQPEVYYSMQGYKKTNLDYVNIPLIFQYMFDNGFRLQVGPQLGVLANAKTNDVNIKNDIESLDLGIGIGFSYINPSTDFGVDFRYNHGLSNIYKHGPEFFNRGFQVGVFYLFQHE